MLNLGRSHDADIKVVGELLQGCDVSLGWRSAAQGIAGLLVGERLHEAAEG